MNKISVITTNRQGLFDLSAALMRAIDPDFLHQKRKPLSVSVRGNIAGGKKIVPDAARINMFDPAARITFEGKTNCDEFWEAASQNQTARIGFINAALRRERYSSFLGMPTNLSIWNQARFFLRHEFWENGGLAFIHNGGSFENESDIQIWLSGPENPYSNDQYDAPCSYNYQSFLDASRDSPISSDKWLRFVEIGVNKEAILDDPNFMDFWTQFQNAPANDNFLGPTPVLGSDVKLDTASTIDFEGH